MPDTYPPIGFIQSCFTEKFGVPRQALMVSEARAVLKLLPDPAFHSALNRLEDFSHLWLVYQFHLHQEKGWRSTIRPPRLNAPRRVGVFASRSPHRPNPIGISAVKLEHIDLGAPRGIELHLSGVDIMNGTPVLDIKPYLPFADSIPSAKAGWASAEIPRYSVSFSPESEAKLALAASQEYPRLRALIAEMLQWDPRPMSQRRAMPIEAPENEGMAFAFRILEQDVHWRISSGTIRVVDIQALDPPMTGMPGAEL